MTTFVELLRALQQWMGQLNTVELLAFGGVLSVLLWCGVVLPWGYHLFFVPLGLPNFWQRMRQDPGAAVALIVMLLVIGSASVYMAFVALMFLSMVAVLKLIFQWVLAAP